LMKEPDLEEEGLKAIVGPGFFTVERYSLKSAATNVTITSPSGEEQQVTLLEDAYGVGRAKVDAKESGMYHITDGLHEATIAMGDRDAAEFAKVTTTDEALHPWAQASGGGVYWLGENVPEIRSVPAGRATAGSRWL